MSAVRASVSAAISAPADARRLTLEIDSGIFTGGIPVRMYPDVPAKLRTSRGSVSVEGSRAEVVTAEIVSFTGSRRASTRRPISGSFSWALFGAAWDADGNEVAPTVSWDPDSGEVVSSIAFYGGVLVSYQANYTRLRYTNQLVGGVAVPGEILAFWNGQVATLQIDSPTAYRLEDYAELYRVYSQVVLDPDGAWELPPNWPDDGTYSDGADGPDPDNSLTDERPHEIGYLRSNGFITKDRQNVRYQQPYTGAISFRPKWAFRRGTAPSGWEQAFLSVDWASLQAEVASRYAGLTF